MGRKALFFHPIRTRLGLTVIPEPSKIALTQGAGTQHGCTTELRTPMLRPD
jgi:hypothetical protein